MKRIIDIPEKIEEYIKDYIPIGAGNNVFCYPDEIVRMIQNGTPIPDNATNERMVGSWIKSRDSYGNNHFTCPFCEHDIATQYADNWEDKYCSECGARMEGMKYEKGYIL